MWEEFFIRIGCNVPLLNAQAMDLKLNHSPLFPFTYYESGTLCEKAENILNQQHESTIKFLSTLPIVTNQNEMIQISKVSTISTQTLLPSISIPDYALSLATRCGVIIHRNVPMCIQNLQFLCENSVTDPSRYFEWLLYLKTLLNEEANQSYLQEGKKEFDSIKIYLPETFQTGDSFYYFKDIIILDTEISNDIKLICIHSHKNVISKKFNSNYWVFSEVLKQLIGVTCRIFC